MSKESVNILEYGYKGDEQITISAREFITLKNAVEKGLENASEEYLPAIEQYVEVETGKVVENPSQEDLLTRKVVPTTDKQATFSSANIKIKYDLKKVSPDLLKALEYIHEIHYRAIEQGIATHVDNLPAQ